MFFIFGTLGPGKLGLGVNSHPLIKAKINFKTNIIASHCISRRQACGLNKASIPNFSILGSLEVAQIYLPGWVGGWGGCHTDIKTNLSSQLDWY